MAGEPPSSEDERPLRPLPTVGMALLPEERRSVRIRRVVGFGMLGAIVVGAVGVWAGGRYLPKAWEWANGVLDVQSEASAAAAPISGLTNDGGVLDEPLTNDATEGAAVEPSALATRAAGASFTTTFGNALSFRQALLNAGLEVQECAEVEQALRHIVDFRRCRPEHRLVIERDEEGQLKRFEYHPTRTEFVELTRSETGGFAAEQIRATVKRTPIARAGSVIVSIGDQLEQLGLPAGLATYFVEAFEGRINFATDARKGDTFRLVVDEERVDDKLIRYGRVHAVEYHGQRTGKVQAFYFAPPGSAGEFYDENGRAMQGGWLRTPLRYDRISSRFNPHRVHPILKRVIPHMGVDYAASIGTPVWAAAGGTVRFAGRKGVNGNLVTIRHRGGYETHYAHLHSIRRGIKPGTRVKQRELIGVVGSTGRSTGPHLHFSLKKNGRMIDPLVELNGPGRLLRAKNMDAYKGQVQHLRAQLDTIEGAPSVVATNEPAAPHVDEVMD